VTKAFLVRALHRPLQEAGLVPENCRLMDLRIGVDGAFVVAYEVFFTPEQTVKLGEVLQRVGQTLLADEARPQQPPPAPPPDLDPGSR